MIKHSIAIAFLLAFMLFGAIIGARSAHAAGVENPRHWFLEITPSDEE
jgi:hypothetical protein